MKILFLIDNLGSGGAQRQMTTIACLLKKRNYDVSFLVYSESNFFAKCLIDNEIPITCISKSNIISRLFCIRKFIRKAKCDAVISFMDTPNFINCFAAIGGHSWKVITSERSAKESTFKNKKNIIFNWFQRYSDSIVCNSVNASSMWRRNYPCYAKKLNVIYNAVEISKLNSTFVPLNHGKIKIVVAASYQALKNPIGLVNALVLLTSEERNRFSIDWYGRKNVDSVGRSSIFDEAFGIVKKHSLNNIINLHGPTSDIHNVMNSADIIALFSYVEGLPNTICEGMTLGKPIIITKVSDYSVFVNDSNGVVCHSTNDKDISIALKSILKFSENDFLRLGNSSRDKACLLFNSEEVISKWIDLINS